MQTAETIRDANVRYHDLAAEMPGAADQEDEADAHAVGWLAAELAQESR